MILPDDLSMAMTSPDCTFPFCRDSIILVPRSYIVSISVVFKISLPCKATRKCQPAACNHIPAMSTPEISRASQISGLSCLPADPPRFLQPAF